MKMILISLRARLNKMIEKCEGCWCVGKEKRKGRWKREKILSHGDRTRHQFLDVISTFTGFE